MLGKAGFGGVRWARPLAVFLTAVLLSFLARPVYSQELATEEAEPRRISPIRKFENAWSDWPQSEYFRVAIEYRNYTYLEGKTRGDSRDSINEGRMRVDYDRNFRENMRIYLNALLVADDDDFTHGFLDIDDDELRRSYFNFPEAFVDLYFESFDLRLGKQIIAWGKADVLNPTDNVSPTDYSNLLDEDEIGAIAANLNYYWSDWNLQIVGVPIFTPSRLPPRGTRFSLIPPDTPFPVEDPELPANTLENAQFGLRLKTTYRGWDFSVSYYDGLNDIPAPLLRFVQIPPDPVPSPVIVPVYNRFRAIGADFATVFGRWGFHGEAAQFIFDGNRQDDRLEYVLGFDFTKSDVLFDHDLFAIVEYVGDHVTEEGESLDSTASLDRVLRGAIAVKIAYSFTEFTVLELRGAVDFEQDDSYYIQPQLVHALTDNFTIIVGADLLGGPRDTFLGQFRDNDRIYTKLIYTF